jgi:hypothetical protein
MKPLPAPPVPGNTEWERFDNAVGMLLNAPRAAFVKQEKKLKRRREKKRAKSRIDCAAPACHATTSVPVLAWLGK